jgi:hypothetical protein
MDAHSGLSPGYFGLSLRVLPQKDVAISTLPPAAEILRSLRSLRMTQGEGLPQNDREGY